MKQAIGMLLWLLLAIAAASVHETASARAALEQEVIRLHILADSDSTADQTDKLLVRDAVLALAAEQLPYDADAEAVCAALRASLPEIQQTAERTLREAGCTDPVRVSLGRTAFPARSYGRYTLPAGDYRALRIEIGSAAGQNWWCVMYPSLCIPAAEAQPPEECLSAEARDLAEHPEAFELRLKCADVCRAAVRLLHTQLTETETPASPEGEAGDTEISSRSRRYCSRRCIRSRCRSRRTEESE